MEFLASKVIAFFATYGMTLLGIGSVGALVGVLLKKLVTQSDIDAWADGSEYVGFAVGRFVTLGLAAWKWTKPIWNAVVEPLVIVIVESTVARFIVGLVKGLRSDNPSTKD